MYCVCSQSGRIRAWRCGPLPMVGCELVALFCRCFPFVCSKLRLCESGLRQRSPADKSPKGSAIPAAAANTTSQSLLAVPGYPTRSCPGLAVVQALCIFTHQLSEAVKETASLRDVYLVGEELLRHANSQVDNLRTIPRTCRNRQHTIGAKAFLCGRSHNDAKLNGRCCYRMNQQTCHRGQRLTWHGTA